MSRGSLATRHLPHTASYAQISSFPSLGFSWPAVLVRLGKSGIPNLLPGWKKEFLPVCVDV